MTRTRPALATGLVLAATAALLLPAGATGKAKKPAPGPKITKVTVSGQTVTVSGNVRLRRNTSWARRAARVTVRLTDASGRAESKVVKLTSKRRFSSKRVTALSGKLTARVGVKVAGKRLGKTVTRRLSVTPSTRIPNGALVGTFRLVPGSTAAGQENGSYFQMIQPGGAPLDNFSSPSANKSITPFTPGTDGGLRTDVFQAPPTPAFAGGSSGHALADRIIRPVPFFGTNFSVVTAPTDPQTGTPDPLPALTLSGETLSGQVTAWAAQWNGQSFNQGTPKPDGTTPAPTTPVSGTLKPDTGAFVLEWRSRIVGGPFNGFTGRWHLEGTFVPAGR